MFEQFFPVLRSRTMEPRRRDPFSLLEDVWNQSQDFPFSLSYPSVDVSETETEVVVKAELPGMEGKDLELSVNNNVLLIKGEKRQEQEDKEENFIRTERYYGRFSRAIPLPAQCSEHNVTARFTNGVLNVRIPKDESAKTRKISIES